MPVVKCSLFRRRSLCVNHGVQGKARGASGGDVAQDPGYAVQWAYRSLSTQPPPQHMSEQRRVQFVFGEPEQFRTQLNRLQNETVWCGAVLTLWLGELKPSTLIETFQNRPWTIAPTQINILFVQHGIRTIPTMSRFFLYELDPTNKTSIQGSSLILEPILPSGDHCGDLDDGSTETIVTSLRGEVGTGTATVPCAPLVWGVPWRYGS